MNLREIILHYKEVSEPCLDEICGSANILLKWSPEMLLCVKANCAMRST